MSPMTAALKGRGPIFRIVFFAVLIPLVIPMFVYQLVLFMLGRFRYANTQYERAFDHGYSRPTYGRQDTNPKHPDVWKHALEKSYEEFASDLRLAALMGIVYRFTEPKTPEEFDRILSDQMASLRRQPDLPGNTTARLWNPANVINFLDEHYKQQGVNDFTHYYVPEAASPNAWRILKLGKSEFKPERRARPVSYHDEYFRATPVHHVEYSFAGDRTSVTSIKFIKTDDAEFAARAVSVLCNFAMSFVPTTFAADDAAEIVARLDVSAPQPFECVVQDARVKLDWQISRPYWSEPDQVFASFTIEKV